MMVGLIKYIALFYAQVYFEAFLGPIAFRLLLDYFALQTAKFYRNLVDGQIIYPSTI